MSTHPDGTDIAKALSKVIHDFRGPLINIRGFAQELNESVAEFAKRADLDAPSLNEVMQEDWQPYLTYILQSVDMLEQRLSSFSSEVDAEK